MKKILCLALVLAMGLSGCGPDVVTWQEEAKQADGSILVLKRTVRLGGGKEIGQSNSLLSESISFTHPKTGKEIQWDAPSDSEFAVDPILLQLDGDRVLVLVRPSSGWSFRKYGDPCPPYILQEVNNGKVVNKPAQELAEKFRYVNIIVAPRIKKSMDRIKNDKYLSINTIKEINSKMTNTKLMSVDYSCK